MSAEHIGFTGHRDIPADAKANGLEVASLLANALNRAFVAGARWFASGGAPGWDAEFLKQACSLRDQHADAGVLVGAYIPFPTYWHKWPISAGLISSLDFIGKVNQGDYKVWKMHARNQFIVDESDAIVAVYDGRKSGGTYQTLKYARKKKVPVYWINPTNATCRWVKE